MTADEKKLKKVSYRVLFPEREEQYIQAEAEKTSYGGILIKSKDKLKVGSLIEIELEGGEKKEGKLKLLGEVKWTKHAKDPDYFSAGVFYLLPTAGRMFQLFMDKNLQSIEDIKKFKK